MIESPISVSQWLSDWLVLVDYNSAQPEGTGDQWRKALEAAKLREPSRFKRLAIWFDEDGWLCITSPRNSISEFEERVPAHAIDEWIEACEKVLDEHQGMLSGGGGI